MIPVSVSSKVLIKKSRISDMRLVKTKKQSASACSKKKKNNNNYYNILKNTFYMSKMLNLHIN